MKKTLIPAILIVAALLFTPLYPVYALDLTVKTSTESSTAAKAKAAPLSLSDQKIAAFNLKLTKFKVQATVDVLQKINDALATVNKNHTNSMSQNLDRMSAILSKIQAMASPSATATSSAKLATTRAQTAIQNAKNAVATQSAKLYIINITSEANAHADAKVQRDLLVKDLTAVRVLVLDAKQALINSLAPTPTSTSSGVTK